MGLFVKLHHNRICHFYVHHWILGLYSQNFIFFVTYEQSPKVRLFVTGKPFWLNVM
jgi:hypothetical protein